MRVFAILLLAGAVAASSNSQTSSINTPQLSEQQTIQQQNDQSQQLNQQLTKQMNDQTQQLTKQLIDQTQQMNDQTQQLKQQLSAENFHQHPYIYSVPKAYRAFNDQIEKAGEDLVGKFIVAAFKPKDSEEIKAYFLRGGLHSLTTELDADFFHEFMALGEEKVGLTLAAADLLNLPHMKMPLRQIYLPGSTLQGVIEDFKDKAMMPPWILFVTNEEVKGKLESLDKVGQFHLDAGTRSFSVNQDQQSTRILPTYPTQVKSLYNPSTPNVYRYVYPTGEIKTLYNPNSQNVYRSVYPTEEIKSLYNPNSQNVYRSVYPTEDIKTLYNPNIQSVYRSVYPTEEIKSLYNPNSQSVYRSVYPTEEIKSLYNPNIQSVYRSVYPTEEIKSLYNPSRQNVYKSVYPTEIKSLYNPSRQNVYKSVYPTVRQF